jgi:uncharacterized protein YprB with RNaseH-like and TPR domain
LRHLDLYHPSREYKNQPSQRVAIPHALNILGIKRPTADVQNHLDGP